jgi:hypothetical protein
MDWHSAVQTISWARDMLCYPGDLPAGRQVNSSAGSSSKFFLFLPWVMSERYNTWNMFSGKRRKAGSATLPSYTSRGHLYSPVKSPIFSLTMSSKFGIFSSWVPAG